mmetsp:Transcript_44349/g.91660  ORF Transcript_44349/g.91660 Transcript_44349/m.91660 type:complete len:243 (-) Transcript_44349:15-743(-)
MRTTMAKAAAEMLPELPHGSSFMLQNAEWRLMSAGELICCHHEEARAHGTQDTAGAKRAAATRFADSELAKMQCVADADCCGRGLAGMDADRPQDQPCFNVWREARDPRPARLHGDVQDRCAAMEADLKQKLARMEGRWNEKCSCLTVEVSRLVDSKLDEKLDVSLWDELKVDVEAAVMTLREMLRTQRVSIEGELKALRSESDVRALEVKSLAKDLRRLLVRGPDAAADGLEGCTSYVVLQ